MRPSGRLGSRGCCSVTTSPPGRKESATAGPPRAAAAGITYRQLDYWARTGLVEPSVRAAQGSGSARLYSFRDILVLKVVKRLLDTGISLQQIRAAVAHLRSRGTDDLAKVTLMSDGVSVYECTSSDEVVDLLQGGQGVFGIALGRIWQEVERDAGRAARRAGGRGRGRNAGGHRERHERGRAGPAAGPPDWLTRRGPARPAGAVLPAGAGRCGSADLTGAVLHLRRARGDLRPGPAQGRRPAARRPAGRA